jgi:predicted transcriptional regulator
MTDELYPGLSMRERQIMDALHRLGSASVAEVRAQIADRPSYNSVRVILTILEKKGHVAHERDGRRYVYSPVQQPARTRSAALRHVLETFFHGSALGVVSALLGMKTGQLTHAELDQIAALIQKEARREDKP